MSRSNGSWAQFFLYTSIHVFLVYIELGGSILYYPSVVLVRWAKLCSSNLPWPLDIKWCAPKNKNKTSGMSIELCPICTEMQVLNWIDLWRPILRTLAGWKWISLFAHSNRKLMKIITQLFGWFNHNI